MTHLVREINDLPDAALDDELRAFIARKQCHVDLFHDRSTWRSRGASRTGKDKAKPREIWYRGKGEENGKARGHKIKWILHQPKASTVIRID